MIDRRRVMASLKQEHNGYEYVDFGLPSGTLWATMNVGASSETDYGNYYKYGSGATAGATNTAYYPGTEDPLRSLYDTATQVWGGQWHMPTYTQFKELTNNTTYQFVTNYKGSGINGGTFTATNGAVLFLPAAGHWNSGRFYAGGTGGFYWSSTPGQSREAYYLYFTNGSKRASNTNNFYGFSVRPVIG